MKTHITLLFVQFNFKRLVNILAKYNLTNLFTQLHDPSRIIKQKKNLTKVKFNNLFEKILNINIIIILIWYIVKIYIYIYFIINNI